MEVRFVEIPAVPAETLARWEQWLAPEKRQRINRLPTRQRLQSLCGDGLAREMLAPVLGMTPGEIVFTDSTNGKPLVEGAFFSISHSGDAVGCAVSCRPVGLDLEQVRPVPPRLGRALGPWERQEEFWQRWTRREAALKCRGGLLGQWKRVGEEGLTFLPAELAGYAVSLCEEKE